MERCLIAFGGNQKTTADTFFRAVEQLSKNGIQPERISTCVRTRAVGENAGDDFLNAAATVLTDLQPHELLTCLHEAELLSGRKRTVVWGPRTLDLDLLLYGSRVIDRPEIVVPHPAMWYRRFVMEPAAEIAGPLVHPILNKTVEHLWRDISARPLAFEIDWTGAPSLREELLQLASLRWSEQELIIRDVSGPTAITDSEVPTDCATAFARIIVSHPELQAHGEPQHAEQLRTQPPHVPGRRIPVSRCGSRSEILTTALQIFEAALG